MHRVFVYGTLKNGQPNHQVLTDVSSGLYKHIADGCTQASYPLVIASRFNVPFLLDKPGTGKQVSGEIYEVDDTKLAALDVLENHPNFYIRRLEPIYIAKEDRIDNRWVYFLPKFRDELLNLETFASYDYLGSHGLKYMPSDDDIETESDIYEFYDKIGADV